MSDIPYLAASFDFGQWWWWCGVAAAAAAVAVLVAAAAAAAVVVVVVVVGRCRWQRGVGGLEAYVIATLIEDHRGNLPKFSKADLNIPAFR